LCLGELTIMGCFHQGLLSMLRISNRLKRLPNTCTHWTRITLCTTRIYEQRTRTTAQCFWPHNIGCHVKCASTCIGTDTGGSKYPTPALFGPWSDGARIQETTTGARRVRSWDWCHRCGEVLMEPLIWL
jgi:hypothetical protein